MEKSTNQAKLESVIATLTILKPRLTETFRRDVEACIRWVHEVDEDLRPATPDIRPLGDLMAEEDQRIRERVTAEALSAGQGVTYLEYPNKLAKWGLAVFLNRKLTGYIEHAPEGGFRYAANTHGGRQYLYGDAFKTIDQVKISIAGNGITEDKNDTENHS